MAIGIDAPGLGRGTDNAPTGAMRQGAQDGPSVRFSARCHASLEAVEPLWRKFEADGTVTAYQRFDWAQVMARHLLAPASATLCIVEVRDEAQDRSVMLLPFVLRRQRFHRVVEWLNLGVCDYSAPILAPGHDIAPSSEEALWTAVRGALPPADLIEIVQMPGEIGGRSNPLVHIADARLMDMQSFGVALVGDAKTVVERTCGSSLRKELRQGARRLAVEGEVRFVLPQTPDEAAALYEVLIQQRLDRFRELGRYDILTLSHVRQFYRDAALASLGQGPVQLFGLAVGQEWVATASGLVHGGAFHGTLLAIGEERWKRSGPGLQLISQIMRWATAQNLTYMDFTVGDMPYKAGFGVAPRALHAIQVPLTRRGRAVLALRQAASSAKARIRRHRPVFDAMRGAMQSIRRMRQRVAGSDRQP